MGTRSCGSRRRVDCISIISTLWSDCQFCSRSFSYSTWEQKEEPYLICISTSSLLFHENCSSIIVLQASIRFRKGICCFPRGACDMLEESASLPMTLMSKWANLDHFPKAAIMKGEVAFGRRLKPSNKKESSSCAGEAALWVKCEGH